MRKKALIDNFLFVLGGDSFSALSVFEMPDEYIDALRLYGDNLYLDYSPSYLHCHDLFKKLFNSKVITQERIFMKTPPSLRYSSTPCTIYDYLMHQLSDLSLEKCATLFLNKFMLKDIKEFLESSFIDALFDQRIVNSISLILGSEVDDDLIQVLTANQARIGNISVLSNYFSIFKENKKLNPLFNILIRSIYSSGFISSYFEENTCSRHIQIGLDKLPQYQERCDYLHILNKLGLLTKANCFHFPVYLSKAHGIILASKDPCHIVDVYESIKLHDKFISENKDSIDLFLSISEDYAFLVQN